MKIHYFQDTDTLLIVFNDNYKMESKDLNENILLDLDSEGRVVSMTIEHARQQTNVTEFTYQFAAN